MISHQGEKGLPGRLSVLVFPLMLAILLASCGGGGGLAADAGASLNNNFADIPAADSFGELLPLGSPLPQIPEQSGPLPQAGERSASAVHVYDGADFLIASGGSVDGSSLLLESSADDVAWAMYKAGGLQNQRVETFVLETRPEDLDTTYYVALGSFTDNRWHWFVESSLPEVNIDLTQNDQRLISRLGNLYWVVLVDNARSLYVDQASIITGDGGNDWKPCRVTGLTATEGQFPVSLSWEPCDEAASYEVWRAMLSDVPEDEWTEPELIATLEYNSYEDFDVAPGLPYRYRVRAANDAGYGGFSEPAIGWAGSAGGGNGECRAVGPVESIDDLSIIVSNHYFIHNADTQWLDLAGNPAGPDQFHPGMFVLVEGYEADNPVAGGGCIATLVQMLDNPGGGGGGGGGDIFVIDGPVTDVNAEYFTLDHPNGFAPQLILHDNQTVFAHADGTPAGWQDMAVGDFVHAEGEITADGAWLARFVVLHGSNGGGGGGGGGGDAFVLDGIVNAISSTEISVSQGPAGMPATVLHDAQTLFIRPDGMEGSWQDVQVGNFVHIDGTILANGDRLAHLVHIHDDNGGGNGGGGGGDFITLDGEFKSANESSFEITGIITDEAWTIGHNDSTVWLLPDGTQGSWQDVATGSHVFVDCQILDDNSLLAVMVLVHEGPPAG